MGSTQSITPPPIWEQIKMNQKQSVVDVVFRQQCCLVISRGAFGCTQATREIGTCALCTLRWHYTALCSAVIYLALFFRSFAPICSAVQP